MLRRSLPDDLIVRLNQSPIWTNIVSDKSLCPEIRDGHVTVYYLGGALLQRLRLDAGNFTAEVNPKYIPVRSATPAVRFTWTDQGFGLPDGVKPLPLGLASALELTAYKEAMKKVLSDFPEAKIVQAIAVRPENCVLDQEIAFQESGGPRDKIDLCHYDAGLGKVVFVEVKRIDDPRLRTPAGRPEILDQLVAYGERLRQDQCGILDAYRTVVDIKRRLGLGARLNEIPEEGATELLDKPVLVIGNCSKADVKAMNAREGEWKLLLDGLKSCAAGLILCGNDGCRLSLVLGSQTLVF